MANSGPQGHMHSENDPDVCFCDAGGMDPNDVLVQQYAYELGITDEDNWDLMDELREAVAGDEDIVTARSQTSALEEFGPNGPDSEPDDPRAYE